MMYKMFFDQSPDIMLIFRGSDGSIIDANEAALRALGCRREELLSKDFYSLNFSEDMLSIISGMSEADQSRIIEITYRGEGAAEFPVIMSLRRVVVKDEKLFFCILIEVTANKRIGAQIQKEREKLEEMVEDRTARLRMSNIQLQKEVNGRKQVEGELRRSRDQLYQITGNMLDMICQTDNEGNYQYASPSHKSVLGYEPDYMLGKSILTFVHPDDLKKVSAAVEEAIETKSSGKVEYRSRRADGQYIWVETTGSLLFDDKGRISGAVFSSRDVTSRKLAEEALCTERKKFESLLEKAPFGIVLLDNMLVFKYINPKFKELFGYDLDEIPKGRKWLRKAFPGPANRHNVIVNWLNDNDERSGEKHARIYTVCCKDGTQKTVSFITAQLESGEFLLTCEDMTQRRWVEVELHKQALFLQRLIDNIPNPVFYKDVNGIYRGCNKAYESLLGRNKNDIIGKSIYDLYPADLADGCHKKDEELFREQDVQAYESFVLYDGGVRHNVIINKAVYFEADGKPDGLVGVISDIEELKKAEEEIRQSEALLRSIVESPNNIKTFSLDKDYRYIFFNKAHHETMKNIWGADIELGKSMLEYITYPEDREKAAANFDRALSGKHFSVIEEYGDKKLNRKFWEDIYSPVTIDTGEIIGLTVFCSDISERMLAEEKLRAANRQLLDIIDFLPDATFAIDLDGRVIAWNRAIEEMTGVCKEDIIGRGEYAYSFPFYGTARPILIDLVYSEDSNVVTSYEYTERKENTIYAEAFTPCVYNGEGAIMWGKASPLFDSEGNLTGAIESIRDISERKKIENALFTERQRFETLVRHLPVGMALFDSEGICRYINPKFNEIFGYSLADVPNKEEWFSKAFPDSVYRKEALSAWEKDLKDAPPGEKASRSFTITCRDGHQLITQITPVKLQTGEFLVTYVDITQKKQLEKELLRIRKAVESTGNAVLMTDHKGVNFIYNNNSLVNLLGYNAEELNAAGGAPVIYHDREIAREVFNTVVRGQSWKGELELLTRDKRIIPAYLHGDAVRDETGEIVAMFGVFTDITERKLAEERLQAANQQLLDIIDFLPDATFVIDRDGRVIAWNHVIEELTGVKKEEILGQGDYAYAVPFHGEPRPIFIDLIFEDEIVVKQHYDYVRKEGNTFYGETFAHSAYRGKGAYLWVKASPLFDKDGQIVGAIQSIRDITGLKHLEERFRVTGSELQQALEKLGERELIDRIIETSPAGVIVVNNDMKITFANARAEQLLGLKSKDKNRHVYKMPKWFYTDYQGNPVPDEELVYKQVISTGRQVLDAAQAIQWPNGTRTLLSINGAPLYDRSGAIEGAVLSIEDVTLRREAEERIISYQKQLRSLAAKLSLVEERERRRIAEGIHDHIGQSLAVARLKIGALKKAASTEAALTNLDEINALVEEAIKNTRSLTFELSPPILYDLGFGAAVEWLGEHLLEKNGVGFNLVNDLRPKSLDEEMRIILFTAVRELFFNIVKHAGARKVSISVQERGDRIQLEVKDDGSGFDTTLIGPEYRKADGFGLFSINERLEHLGGRMEIESKPGYGTRITIEAPLTNNH